MKLTILRRLFQGSRMRARRLPKYDNRNDRAWVVELKDPGYGCYHVILLFWESDIQKEEEEG
jgi:hypothetical protein